VAELRVNSSTIDSHHATHLHQAAGASPTTSGKFVSWWCTHLAAHQKLTFSEKRSSLGKEERKSLQKAVSQVRSSLAQRILHQDAPMERFNAQHNQMTWKPRCEPSKLS
jgi:hypothetical protein